MRLKGRRHVVADSCTLALFGDDVISVDTTSQPLPEELPAFDFRFFLQASESIAIAPTAPIISTIPEEEGSLVLRATPVATVPVVRNQRNFAFSTDDIPRGKEARFQANVEALQIRKTLSLSGDAPTPEQMRALAQYSGWGGLGHVFLHGSRHVAALQAVLSEDELQSVRTGVLTQHFTPDLVVDFIYQALIRLGVNPRRILDPALGTGVFAARVPREWRQDVKIYGCELDPVVASIASLLLADVHVTPHAFQSVAYPDDAFDLVITNVPFDNTKVFDRETPNEKLSLHNFFLAKALRKVRPGGVVAVVTSTYTLDAKEPYVRTVFSDSADLIAAARLPGWMFVGTASTEVSSDVLIFRKRHGHEMKPLDPAWISSEYHQSGLLNSALKDTPQWWIGTPQIQSTKHGMRWAADADQEQVPGLLQAWVDTLPKGRCHNGADAPQAADGIDRQIRLEHLRHMRPGAFAEHQGRVVVIRPNRDVDEAGLPESIERRVRAYIRLRDATKSLLLLQAQSQEDEPVNTARAELNGRYDAFVQLYGAVNARFNRTTLKEDPDYTLVCALESYDSDTKTATKAPVLLRRTLRPRVKVQNAETPQAALLVVLSECARVDMDRIAQLCGCTTQDAQDALQQAGRVFKDPVSGEWELAELYLSGDIQVKLSNAELASVESPEFAVNVRALQAAMPQRIEFKDIAIQLGSTFIAPLFIEDFIDYLMDNEGASLRAAEVMHVAEVAMWKVKASSAVFGNAETKWGTKRIDAFDLVEKALNMMSPTVRDRKVSADKVQYVVNSDETLSAREKQMAIQEEFKTWIGRCPERVKVIEDRYNREYNTCRPLTVDGSHLQLPGLSDAIHLRESQKSSIWRNLVSTGNTLVGHCVGAGKTLIGICTAMEAKRIGLRQCTLITTPSSVVGQFAREFVNAYPCANLLVIDGVDKKQRERLLASVATGDFDAVIMSHETFGSFGVSEAQMQQVAAPMYRALNRALSLASDRTLLKQLERRKLALDQMLDSALREAKASPMTFDQLGCDMLIVDEAQAFKNLWYTTSMEPIPGLPSAFSQRAFDMFCKSRALSVRNGERGGVVFMTATPIANTVAEMFHLMRYLIHPTLVEKGLDQFDAWAANFGRTVVNLETTPDGGGFRLQTRFARFENIPELMALFGQFADIQTKEDLQLPVPKIVGGKPTVIAVPPSAALKAYIQSLAKRAEKIHSSDARVRPKPSVDNMLKVTTDGRLAALDMRMVGGVDEPNSKVNVAVETIYRIWDETKLRRLTQLVFCDIGTPGNARCDIYQDIKDKLVRRGVPEGEIAFAHDFNTPAKKILLDTRINRGDVRITITSTERMGIGRNVQRLLYATHDLDCPWRPDQVEQRGGRIERQGNLNEEVLMFRYVTEQSFDAYNWNLIEQKLRFILQVMTSKCLVRSIEDVEERALTVAEVKALATGNPMVIERALLQQREAKLVSLSRTYYSDQAAARQRVSVLESNIVAGQQNLERVLEDVATAAANPAELPIQLSGRLFDGSDKHAVADALQSAFANVAAHMVRGQSNSGDYPVFEIGAYRGFKLGIGAVATMQGLQYQWEVEGTFRWATELGADWDGNYTRIRNLVKRLSQEADKRAENLKQSQKAREDIEQMCNGTFPRAAELDEVRRQLSTVEHALGLAELDAQAVDCPSEEETVVE